MNDYYDDDDFEGFSGRGRTPTGRVYVHTRCGGHTEVSGMDYTHICDPFWPCTSTYCCQCAGFAPLKDVCWADTGETVSKYRSRMRRETPILVQVWRYGAGLLFGAAPGIVLGLLVALIVQAPSPSVAVFALFGGLIGGLLCYLLGTVILNKLFDVDYRRMR